MEELRSKRARLDSESGHCTKGTILADALAQVAGCSNIQGAVADKQEHINEKTSSIMMSSTLSEIESTVSDFDILEGNIY